MTRGLARLCAASTFSGCLLVVSSSCAVFQPGPLQTAPSRDAQLIPRQRLAQLSFGRQAAFAVCAEPACPQVTPKTIAASAPQPDVQPVVLREPPLLAPITAPVAAPIPLPVEPAQLVPASTTSSLEGPTHQVVVSFPFASSALTPSAKAALAGSLRHATASETIAISGRTDSVGNLQVNEALALARALAVRDYLRDLAPDIAATIDIEAKGRCCFIASNADEHGRAQNRRVQVVFNGPRGV
jgi:outer membrane protein OmpA-like peptidoglycan-associated protein